MDLRDPPSRLEKLRRLLTGRKRKPDGTGAETGGGGINQAYSVLPPEPYVVAVDDHDEGNGASVDSQQVRSTGRPPQPDEPEPVQASGSGDHPDADGREVNQKYSHLHSDVEMEAGSGPSREGNDARGENDERVYPSPPALSIPHSGKPDNVINTTIPDRFPEVLGPNYWRPAADENKSNLRSTMSLLRTVRDSPDAFPLLKSVAGNLYTILENPERTAASEQAIERLAPRVELLAELLGEPIHESQTGEKIRSITLERKLEDVLRGLTPLVEQGMVVGFPTDTENVQGIDDLVEDIRDATMEYQTSLQKDIYDESCRLIESMDIGLLRGINHAPEAGYICGNRQGCLRGTRNGLLCQIERWLTDGDQCRVFWLNGLAGTGKSTIAQTFAETAFADGKLGASFFCSRDFEDRRNLQAIFPTLAFQLAYQYPPFRRELLQVLKARPNAGRESLFSQMENIIVNPLKATHISTLIIIDALDECKDEEPTSSILSILSRYVNEIPNVKFFITGRPEPRIRSGFRLVSLRPITETLRLHDVEPEAVNSDIKRFFRARLTDLAKTRSNSNLTEGWPSSSDIEILCKKAAGFFLYASATAKFVASRHHIPSRRLALVTSLPQNNSREGSFGIDLLYAQVLSQWAEEVGKDEEVYSYFRTVMGAILLTFNPLSIKGLSVLLRHHTAGIFSAINALHSLLLVPDNAEDPILIFHASFPHFLTDLSRCEDKRFFVDPTTHHTEILLSCLRLMGEGLKKNICNLDDPVTLSGVGDLFTRRRAYVGDALEYACHFWTKHLLGIPGSSSHVEEVQRAVDNFFMRHLLHWIEVLALTASFGIGVYSMNDIEGWYASVGIPCKWTNDSRRFLSEHFNTICDSPSQMYHSALPLCPASSWLREYYSEEFSQGVKVVMGLPAEWGACSRTVAFDNNPLALVYWKDTIAVGLQSHDIILLDAITGSQTFILSGHTGWVKSLTFSSDGTLLVSGSHDKTVKLWDIQTCGIVKTFHGHTDSVCSVSISSDYGTIASGSLDQTIRLWDPQTGECGSVIDGLDGNVNSVSFSPSDPQLLISASGDHTVRRWDTNGHQAGPTYRGDHAAFSLDGTRFVSWRGSVATVRDSDSGVVVAELQAPGGDFRCCCLSPSNEYVAGGVDRTIYIWNITRSDLHPVETFVGHTDGITSLAFSSSLISASEDNTVKFWQVGAPPMDPTVTNPGFTPPPRAPVTFISIQTNDGIAISSNSAGVVRTWDLSTGLCKASFVTAVKGGRDARLVDGRLIVVCDGNDWTDGGEDEGGSGKIQIWDVEKSELLQAMDAPGPRVIDLWISGDGAKVFCLGEGSLRAWSIWTGENTGEVRFQSQLQPDALTVGGTRVWVHFARSPPQGWDFGIPGSPPVPLSNSSRNKPRLDITDGTKAQNADVAKVKDAVSGREFFQLSGRFANPCATQCDHRYLVAGYESGEVLILDFTHMLSQ